jgi:hypothetical protein
MQLAGAANGDKSLGIIQVSFNHPQIASSFYALPIFYCLYYSSWYGVVLSQKHIIQTVNEHPNAGWTAGHNPYLANYTVNINTLLLVSSRHHFSSLFADLKIILLCAD